MIARSGTDRRATPRAASLERRLLALEMIREDLGLTPPPPATLSPIGAAALTFAATFGPALVFFAWLHGAG